MQSNCSGSQLNTVRRDEIVVNFGTVHVNSSKLKSVTIFATSGTFCISGSICRDVSCPEILLPFRVKRGEPFVANFTWQPSQAYDLNHRIHFRSQSGALLVISIIGRSESRSPRMWSLDHRKKQLELDGRMKIKAATLIQKCWKRYKMRETVSKKWAEMAAQLKQLDGVAKVIQRWWRTARVRKNQVLMKRPSAEVLIYDKLPNLLSWLFTSSGQISAELQVESCPLFDTETLIIDLKCAKKFMKDLDRVRCDLRELVQLLDENGIRNKCQNNCLSQLLLCKGVKIKDVTEPSSLTVWEICDTNNNCDQQLIPTNSICVPSESMSESDKSSPYHHFISTACKFTRRSLRVHSNKVIIAIPVIILAAYAAHRLCNKTS